MWIRAISAHGLSGLPLLDAKALGRVVRVGGPLRAQGALFNALTLAFGAFSTADTERAFARLGQGREARAQGEALPDFVEIGRPERLRALLDPQGDRTLKLHLELELDPPQFGLIREQALRSPELAAALGQDAASLRVSLGWAFTADLAVASCDVLGVRLGDVVPTPGAPSAWRDALLKGLAGRGRVREPMELDVSAVAAAERAADPSRRAGFLRLREALSEAPFSLDELQVVDAGDADPWIAMGASELTPLWSLGPSARDAVGLCEALFIGPSEILALRAPAALAEDAEALLAWLEALVQAERSPLEQLWLFDVPGPYDLELSDAPPPTPRGRLELRR